jgi:hypothetical protein
MAKIAIDIDSTLYDFEAPMRQAFLDLAAHTGDKETYYRGAYQSWVEWRSPTDVCGWDPFMEALDIVHSPTVIAEQVPFPRCADTISRLREEHEIFFISNRSPEVEFETYRWIKGNIMDGEDFDLICTMDDKRPHLDDCQYLIDDRPKTLVEFVYDYDYKRKAFGLMYEYNRGLTDLDNIYLAPTWGGLADYLEAKGVIAYAARTPAHS